MKNRIHLSSTLLSFFVFIVGLILNFYAGIYATKSASNSVTDIILSNIRVFDVDTIFIYGPVVLWIIIAIALLRNPHKIPFTFESVGIFLLVRSLFVTLTHIGPFPEHVLITSSMMSIFTTGGDLFFSGHTGIPYLMALIFWKDVKLRVFFFLSSLFFGIIVLLGHLHYSIDVAGAFFITYTIYHISRNVFKKDCEAFEKGYQAKTSSEVTASQIHS